ncbi:MAG: M48 family metallopeptidase [Gemmobacter sp.]
MPHLPGLPQVEIQLRRSARARRLSLRVSRADGSVTLTLPHRMREAAAMAFLSEHEDWLRKTLAARPVGIAVGIGAVVPVEGSAVTLAPAAGRQTRLDGTCLYLPGDPATAGARAQAFLKAMARDRLAAGCDRHAETLGLAYTALTLRDTRSRWGSCSAEGRLMFNWRLVMAPAAVLDYVAAHEVAHLAEMNHGPRFWATVARLCPGHAAQRRWLRTEGETLHRYRFGT